MNPCASTAILALTPPFPSSFFFGSPKYADLPAFFIKDQCLCVCVCVEGYKIGYVTVSVQSGMLLKHGPERTSNMTANKMCVLCKQKSQEV